MIESSQFQIICSDEDRQYADQNCVEKTEWDIT